MMSAAHYVVPQLLITNMTSPHHAPPYEVHYIKYNNFKAYLNSAMGKGIFFERVQFRIKFDAQLIACYVYP